MCKLRTNIESNEKHYVPQNVAKINYCNNEEYGVFAIRNEMTFSLLMKQVH